MAEIREKLEINEENVTDAVRNTTPIVTFAPQVQEQLIDLITEEIKRLTAGMKFIKPEDGTETATLNFYKQATPLEDVDDEGNSIFPYCLVKFVRSATVDVSMRETVDVVLGFGVFTEDTNRQYQHYLFHIFNVIKKRFIADNFLENFRCEPEMTFALSPEDESTYPHYFGAIGMRWVIPGVDREVDFYS